MHASSEAGMGVARPRGSLRRRGRSGTGSSRVALPMRC
jgi:hypothetical protein